MVGHYPRFCATEGINPSTFEWSLESLGIKESSPDSCLGVVFGDVFANVLGAVFGG